MLDGRHLEHDLESRGARRGRKPAGESRAAEIRARLAAWKQTPEQERISLRTLAAELGTSHQLLSFYLRGLDKRQINRAKTENRSLTAGEEEARSGKLSGRMFEELCKTGHGKVALELFRLAK